MLNMRNNAEHAEHAEKMLKMKGCEERGHRDILLHLKYVSIKI